MILRKIHKYGSLCIIKIFCFFYFGVSTDGNFMPHLTGNSRVGLQGIFRKVIKHLKAIKLQRVIKLKVFSGMTALCVFYRSHRKK